MHFAVIAQRRTETNARLADAPPVRGIEWSLLTPEAALEQLGPGDVALGRLDVLPTLDGVDEGLWTLGELAAAGVRVLNGPSGLLAAHDKLLTARLLHGAGLPHPRTRLVVASSPPPVFDGPVVVKPRFGSWGRDVVRCDDADTLARHLGSLDAERWFRRHGALVQELVEPRGFDLRVVVAGGAVVGAAERVSQPGEWRTNVALGARRVPASPPAEARLLALSAASAAGTDLVGVDLLPLGDGWTVLELNGAVDFTPVYSLERDVFAATSSELARLALGLTRLPEAGTLVASHWDDLPLADEPAAATLME